MGWDESADLFALGLGSFTGASIGNLTISGYSSLKAQNITAVGDLILDDGGSIKEAGGVAAITIDGSAHVTKIGQSTHSTGHFLKWDGSKAVWSSTATAGGSDTQIQYNNGGSALGGISAFTWDDTSLKVGDNTKLKFGADNGAYIQYNESSGDALEIASRDSSPSIIKIYDGTNGNIEISPNGTGHTILSSGNGNNVGIGGFSQFSPAAPQTRLHMVGEAINSAQLRMDQHVTDVDGPDIRFYSSRGTASSPTVRVTDDFIGAYNALYYNGSSYSASGFLGWQVGDNASQGESYFNIKTNVGGNNRARINVEKSGAIKFGNSTDGHFTFPLTDGNANQILKTNGSGTLSWIDCCGISDVADDNSPQLGGNLDVNGRTITSTSNGDIVLVPNGTGDVALQADTVKVGDTGGNPALITDADTDGEGLTLKSLNSNGTSEVFVGYGTNSPLTFKTKGAGKIDIKNVDSGAVSGILFFEASANGTNYVGIQPPTSIASSITWTLPAAEGQSGQVLSTNGSGALSWVTASTAGGSQTLTNKTIDGDNNTVSNIQTASIKSTSKTGSDTRVVTGTAGSVGQVTLWNSDGDVIGDSDLTFNGGTNMLTVGGSIKTSGHIVDGNGNELIKFSNESNAVNSIEIANSATNNSPLIAAAGDDTNISIFFQAKGTGSYSFSGSGAQAAVIELKEDADNGNNFVAIKAPETIASDRKHTLPDSADDTIALLAATQAFTNKTLTSAVLNGSISGTSIKDEDNMSSDSATHLATQQSIKAYVDASSGVSVSNNVNNRVVTGTGSALNAEGNLMFDGSTLAVAGTTTTKDLGIQQNDGSVGGAKFYENSTNGSNYIEIKADSNLASNVTLTLPTQGTDLASTTLNVVTYALANGNYVIGPDASKTMFVIAGAAEAQNLVTFSNSHSWTSGTEFYIINESAVSFTIGVQDTTNDKLNGSNGTITVGSGKRFHIIMHVKSGPANEFYTL